MNESKAETYMHDTVKTYRVVRMRLQGYSMSIPERTPDGSYRCRKLWYEEIEFDDSLYRCAKDHQDRVIYIDTHKKEVAVESSG